MFRDPGGDAESSYGWYEEGLTLWQASSAEEAIELAEAEASRYAGPLRTEYVGLAPSYWLFNAPLHGKEIFSLIRGSDLEPNEFINTYFDTGTEEQARY